MHFCSLGTNVFHVRAENEKFTAGDLRCRQNLKYENFTSSFGRLRQKMHQKACGTIFFLIPPIKSLICGVVVIVAVVIFLNSCAALLSRIMEMCPFSMKRLLYVCMYT